MSIRDPNDANLQDPLDGIARLLESLNESISNVALELHKLQSQSQQWKIDGEAAISSSTITSRSSKDLVRKARDRIRSLDVQLGAFENVEYKSLTTGEEAEAEVVLLTGKKDATVNSSTTGIHNGDSETNGEQKWLWPLQQEEYQRYGRQLIMPEIGLEGQLHLKRSSVLIIGAGGLGCPAAQYLAAAGVGTLGLVDGDTVEASNLHRQILHRTDTVGWSKVKSAVRSLRALNPLVTYKEHATHLYPQNALEIFAQYDVVLDCTDHPTSRYLISDAAVIQRKVLVSASALKTDGQLIVLNNPPAPPGDANGGPCYRCIFPKPPPADSIVSCGEGGVLGPVVGAMGVLQALEAIKLVAAGQHLPTPPPPPPGPGRADPPHDTPAAAAAAAPVPVPSLLIFSGTAPQPFRSVRLRGRKPACAACSAAATVSAGALAAGALDYTAFCGVAAPVDDVSPAERVSAAEYAAERRRGAAAGSAPLLVDVRDATQFALCSLPGAVNVPWARIAAWTAAAVEESEEVAALRSAMRGGTGVRVVCRLGNDSQLAVRRFKELGVCEGIGEGRDSGAGLKHVVGGWRAWRRDVDGSWPDY